jgi:outer membrane lipoprotein LolB
VIRVRAAAALLFALFLAAGCAPLRPAATDEDALAAGLPVYSVDGKVSWRAPEGAGRAAVSWAQTRDRARMVLSGPFGAGAAVLEEDSSGARLRVGEQRRTAPDAGTLIERELGIPLPVAQARHWVLGTLAPGRGRVVERDAAGRPARIEQAGWQVAFERRRSVDGFALPGRIEMTHGDVRLLFVATRWRPLVADFPVEG